MNRVCSKCEKTKPLIAGFHKSNVGLEGRHSICKECRIAYNGPKFQEWRRENPVLAKKLRVAAEERRKLRMRKSK